MKSCILTWLNSTAAATSSVRVLLSPSMLARLTTCMLEGAAAAAARHSHTDELNAGLLSLYM